jgi:excisionase family DNA binding protein
MNNGKHPGGRPRKKLLGEITRDPANGSFYTVDEAAELLGVHVRTVQARLRDGTLKGKKLSGAWRIYKESLQAPKGEQK